MREREKRGVDGFEEREREREVLRGFRRIATKRS